MPTKELGRLGAERGIHVHVDGAQTCGAMRLALGEFGIGSYSASGQKWLMGPRELGLLYVRNDRIPAVWPTVIGTGWGQKAEPNLPGARRYETLGQRDDAAAAGLAAVLDFQEQIGIDRIERRVIELAGRLADGLTGIEGVSLRTPTGQGLSLGVVV